MYAAPYPADRPAGLRRRSLRAGTELWRIDSTEPSAWIWDGFATPRHRFDSATGLVRTRYAGQSMHGAARERYLDTGLFVPADHDEHRLVRLTTTRPFRVLDLRTESNLHTLDADDRINTSHEPDVWQACHRLVDAVRSWWPDLDGIVYQSRTTPATSANVAFWSIDGLDVDARELPSCAAELDDLILHHHFTVDFDY
ncbi:MAG: RES family NAD+ phosphorylase [Acidimicrobiales bacterium]|nr:RES family NAD+ phosphorylase [Acidimicrobiales bacterium]